MVKNRAITALQAAQTERQRSSSKAAWAYSEAFTSTTRLDMSQTTAWIDASEGVCILPNAGLEQTVVPDLITIISSTYPTGGAPITSAPQQAFDGLADTSWQSVFTVPNGQYASCVAQLKNPETITAITIDPIGFGLDLLIEVDNGTGYQELMRGLVYSKSTYAVEKDGVQRIRISYLPASTALPKVVGIREVTLYTSVSTNFASVYSLPFRPTEPFVDVMLDTTSQIPGGASVRGYVRPSTQDPWTELQFGVWTPIAPVLTQRFNVDIDQAQPQSVFRGLYGLNLVGSPAASQSEGTLDMGEGQVEVTAFSRDWAEQGDAPHILVPGDFDVTTARKTWADVRLANLSPTSYIVQTASGSLLSGASLVKGQEVIFHRRISSPNNTGGTGRSDAPYGELCIVPLGGRRSANMLQFGYNYRMRFWVHCTKELFYGSTLDAEGTFAKYWFLQGYRKDGARPYREVGKSWGAFSLYVNGELVAGDSSPYTIYATGEALREPGATLGKPFAFKLSEGWNEVQILVSVVDPSSDLATYDDILDYGDPYLQLSLTPDFFDPGFQQTYGIDRILASGTRRPVSEFDLLWNLPRDTSYWCWSEDKTSLLFNNADPLQIDGAFKGRMPRCVLDYRTAAEVPSDLYVRFDLQRDALSKTGPVLDEYRVMVK